MYLYVSDLLKAQECTQHIMCMLEIQKEIVEGIVTHIYLCFFDPFFLFMFPDSKKYLGKVFLSVFSFLCF